jgi:hypothetical protein
MGYDGVVLWVLNNISDEFIASTFRVKVSHTRIWVNYIEDNERKGYGENHE